MDTPLSAPHAEERDGAHVQAQPVMDENPRTAQDLARGIVAQVMADKHGHDSAEVLAELNERFRESGVTGADEVLEQIAAAIGSMPQEQMGSADIDRMARQILNQPGEGPDKKEEDTP